MSAKLLCVGDILLDRYVYGTVERMSPEAPVPVLKLTGEVKEQPGGAAAVACMCDALGAKTTLSGVADPAIFSLLPLSLYLDVVECQQRAVVKQRFLSDKGQLLRVDVDTEDEWTGVTQELWLQGLVASLSRFDVVLVADYGKGTLSREALRAICRAHPKVIVDPARGRDWRDYDGAWGIKANQDQTRDALKRPLFSWRVTTSGNEGMELCASDHKFARFPARKSVLRDAIGAGDQVLACLGVMLAEGRELVEACRIANICAGLGVEKFGTTPVTRSELEAALAQEHADPT